MGTLVGNDTTDRDDAELRSMHAAAWRLLMTTIRFGEHLGAAIASRADDPSMIHNAPLAVITELALRGPRRPSQLAAFTGLTSGGLTKLVDRLEESGLVVRAVGGVPSDRRAVTIRLTEQGERLAATVGDTVLEQLSLVRQVLAEMTSVVDLVDADLETWDGDDGLSRRRRPSTPPDPRPR